ncbi:MAG: YHS domain-containing (seleno)protein [Pseudomonadota bacterium]
MTSNNGQGRVALRLGSVIWVAALFLGISQAGILRPQPAAANEQILSHPAHQLGLLGYDAVAFFADEGAVLGSADHELIYRGLVWRFVHEANKRAFAADPARYLPAYGGFDARKAASGIAAASDPRVYLVLGQRLFLFASPASRYAFLLNAERTIVQADNRWPELLRTLAP